jgi:hypothetical protein
MPTFGKVVSQSEFRQLDLFKPAPEKPALARPVYTEGVTVIEHRSLSPDDLKIQAAVERHDEAHLAWVSAWNAYSPKDVLDNLWSTYIQAYEAAQDVMRSVWDLKIPA